jgi:hypothetical protein
VVLSHSIIDAMRADRANAASGAFNIDINEPKSPTGTTFAQRSVAAWRAELISDLGEGSCRASPAKSSPIEWSPRRQEGRTRSIDSPEGRAMWSGCT